MRAWIEKNKIFFLITVGFITLKTILGVLLFFGIPDLGNISDLYVPTGDDVGYIKEAQNILKGDIFSIPGSLGYPVFISFVMLITGITSINNIVLPLLIINVFIFSTIFLVLALFIVRHFWKNIFYTLFSGIVFLGLPYLWYFLFKDFVLVNAGGAVDPIGFTRSLHLFGMIALSDWFAACLGLGGFLFFLYKKYFWAGLFLGASFFVRAQYAPVLLFLFVILLLKNRKKIWHFVFGGALTSWPEFVQNFIYTKNPFVFQAYTAESNVSTRVDGIGIHNILSIPERLLKHSPYMLPVMIVAILLIIAAFYYFKNNKEKLYFLLAVGVLSPAVLFLTAPALRNPRYFIPFIPFFIIFLFANYELIFKKKKYERFG